MICKVGMSFTSSNINSQYSWGVTLKKKKKSYGEFPGSPVVRTLLPLKGAQIQSLVGELRSHMLGGVDKKKQTLFILLKVFLYVFPTK